ncbi:pyridoxamine 5'-phosphate oxidase family protein [Cohnella nanjingensis]|uniref:Pyridoxamine 5'-phosphate oxidase family protein n=1 Tax=Cohnella nanjingensis TaxID=1387779 RepID=A0A7X0RX84_9BACL|nr:pyridoxamine 5'-phosphate oxidase family protein [Cohnella nanjingensis]MBB6675313.1 pyridoxamine 5'-phosphate oxidase family protein [Cohnella nanjingensis]
MGKLFEQLLPEHERFIRAQKMFFVGSAPANGHVNLSPKGYDSFRILSPTAVAYLDLTGSGNETSAHLKDNGRITIMFIAYEGAPLILRLYGTGRTVMPDTPEWEALLPRFEKLPGARQMIVADLHAVKTSCGYSIPYYEYAGERDTLRRWADQKGGALGAYHREKNAVSMDGIVTPLGDTFERAE